MISTGGPESVGSLDTTGGSTLEALDAVLAAGAKVARVLCIVDRGEGAADAFAARGLELESLFGRSDLPT